MSEKARVYVHGVEIHAWRYEVELTFLFLFTSEDVTRRPKDPEDMIDDDDTESVYLVASARVLAARLDVLGIGRTAVENLFKDEIIPCDIERLDDFEDSERDPRVKLLQRIPWTTGRTCS